MDERFSEKRQARAVRGTDEATSLCCHQHQGCGMSRDGTFAAGRA